MEDISGIDFLSENDINDTDDEEDKKLLSAISEMKFNAPFEKYIINQINAIIKDNYKKIMPLFEKKEYFLKEIIEEFELYYQNTIAKEKKKMNKSSDIPNKKDSKILDLNQSDIKDENNSAINILVGNKKKNNESSFISLNSAKSLDIFLNDKKANKQKAEINQITRDENTNLKKETKELKNFLDIYNVKGTEFECHTQILLTQILKCFEKEENSFKLLCNIQYKLGNIYDNFKDMEFDFIINNIDGTLFFELIQYLEKNILILKFKENMYEIFCSNNFDKILPELKKFKQFDVLGEIGVNAINDENKIKQFINYSKFLNFLNQNKDNNENKINLFYEKTGFSKENEKILFFITDSNFNEIYKYLSESKLYKAMKESKENTNFILCYLSSGLNEKMILNKFLINYNENKEKKENNDSKTILDNIKLSNENYFKSEKFQAACNKLNDLLINIDNIKSKFIKKSKKDIQTIFETFSIIISDELVKINKDLEKYFQSINTPINFYDKKYSIEEEFVVLYIKKILACDDKMSEILNNMKIKYTTIYLNQKEDTNQKIIKNLKNNHNSDKIYFLIGNCLTSEEKKLFDFIDDLILNLNINKAHYIFLYNPKYSGKIENYKDTLKFNINVSKDEYQFKEQYKNAKKKICSCYGDIQKIIKEKKYYDLLIKSYINKSKTYIMNLAESDELNLIKKINEIFYFMSNLEFTPNIPEVFNESNFKGFFEFINKIVKTFVDSEINDNKINKVFKEIKASLTKDNNYFLNIKNKIKSFCFNYLKRSLLDDIYLNFIEIIIPKLSFQAFNEKIQVFFDEKEKPIALTEGI